MWTHNVWFEDFFIKYSSILDNAQSNFKRKKHQTFGINCIYQA